MGPIHNDAISFHLKTFLAKTMVDLVAKIFLILLEWQIVEFWLAAWKKLLWLAGWSRTQQAIDWGSWSGHQELQGLLSPSSDLSQDTEEWHSMLSLMIRHAMPVGCQESFELEQMDEGQHFLHLQSQSQLHMMLRWSCCMSQNLCSRVFDIYTQFCRSFLYRIQARLFRGRAAVDAADKDLIAAAKRQAIDTKKRYDWILLLFEFTFLKYLLEQTIALKQEETALQSCSGRVWQKSKAWAEFCMPQSDIVNDNWDY